MRRELSSQWQDLGEFIRGQREITQLSLRRMAELANVSNPYLIQIERGLRRPSPQIHVWGQTGLPHLLRPETHPTGKC